MSQPVEVYPNTVIRQPESSNSNGSYGPVFIVLAVIFAMSVVACVLGRLCNRRHHRAKEVHHRAKEVHHHHNNHQQQQPPTVDKLQSHELGPKEWQKPSFKVRERGDIEFGFDKRIPSAKVANNGGGILKPPHYDNGGRKPAVRFADNV